MQYEYSELKGKLKVGQKVRAVSGKLNPCDELNDDGSDVQKITEVDKACFRINGCLHFYVNGCWLEIVDEAIDWDTLAEAHMVEEGGDKRLVLARLGNVIFLSRDESDSKYSSGFTVKELQNMGYTIVQPEQEVMELTVADVEAKFGRKVKIVKGK